MALEIERKYLVDHAIWDSLKKGKGLVIRQGYLSTDPHKTIRVRLVDEQAYLTIKGINDGMIRTEFEYEIPRLDAEELLDHFSHSELSKLRYEIKHQGKTWDVDEFLGENEGLIVAEIELDSEDESFDLPDWVGEEVTGQEKYYNSNLSQHPFKKWLGPAENIQGLKYLNKEIAPNGKSFFSFRLDENVSLNEVIQFLNSIPDGYQFSFFDPSHEKKSDPGAYVFVQKNEGVYFFYLANSGWESKWEKIENQELADNFYKNRTHQRNNIVEIYPSDKKAVEGSYPSPGLD